MHRCFFKMPSWREDGSVHTYMCCADRHHRKSCQGDFLVSPYNPKHKQEKHMGAMTFQSLTKFNIESCSCVVLLSKYKQHGSKGSGFAPVARNCRDPFLCMVPRIRDPATWDPEIIHGISSGSYSRASINRKSNKIKTRHAIGIPIALNSFKNLPTLLRPSFDAPPSTQI